jgi:4-methyl-5(b-hydroxyethyl)-thiazole monophosphate biosynthesis
MNKLYVFLASGFEETEALGTLDVLKRAGFEVVSVSVTGNREVTGSHNITVVADIIFNDTDFSDGQMLILPGGMPGARNLQAHDGLGKLLRQYAETGKFIGAICAAPKVLGHLGLLNGKKATCYPGFENELTGATIVSDNIVRDGTLITAKGPAFSLHFGLEITKALRGEDLAQKVADGMLIEK